MATTSSPRPSPRPLSLTKRALSLFFRVGCERQFLLYLYSDKARKDLEMPLRQEGRSVLGQVGQRGYAWQAKKVLELQDAFGLEAIHGGQEKDRGDRFSPVDLAGEVDSLRPYRFIVEPSFYAGTHEFRVALGVEDLFDSHGNRLELGDLQPDLIQVLPPLAQHAADIPDLSPAFREEVLPDGRTRRLDAADPRLRLRVLDVKLASEPGAHYFAEVVFYAMALAGWIRAKGLAEHFAVVAAPAVVPGSVADSALSRKVLEWKQRMHVPSAAELTQAFEEDVEIAPVEAFAPRLQQMRRKKLPELLQKPWTETKFHVDYRCQGCEFLGDPDIVNSKGEITQKPNHCWPLAEATGDLSRVPGLTRGGSDVLRVHGVGTVPELADVVGADAAAPQGPFSEHHGLRSRRTIFPSRAQSLQSGQGLLIPNSGGDAIMPRWPDLHMYLFLDYDPATGYTVSMGCRAFWKEPLPYKSPLTGQEQKNWWGRNAKEDGGEAGHEVFVVEAPEESAERREFMKFLRHLRGILRWAEDQDSRDVAAGRRGGTQKTPPTLSTYQIYLWDGAQQRHFVRLVSRYLPYILADPDLRQIAWLMPPPELLARAEESSRRTPFTIVEDVVQNTVAIPTPHHYTLLQVAEHFKVRDMPAPTVHPRYRETLSNLVPAERIHEFWTRKGKYFEIGKIIEDTTRKKLLAMGLVVDALEKRLDKLLSRQSAPTVTALPRRTTGLSPEGYLWLEFTQLNAALQGLEVHRMLAMPPHEREARFKSARLVRRLEGAERQDALAGFNRGFRDEDDLLVYELASGSRDLNARPGDIDYALSPASAPTLLDAHPFPVLKDTSISSYGSSFADAGLTGVSIEDIDRKAGVVVLRPGLKNQIAALERETGLDFRQQVQLDKVHHDYLSSKVSLTLRGIGNPPCARPTPRMLEALGLPAATPSGTDPIGPAAEVLWQARELQAQTAGRDTEALRSGMERALAGAGLLLTSDQWAAWGHALSQRLTLIWGPPGTGKSHTLRAVVAGAVRHAAEKNQPIRVLVTANTYTAVDNILLKLQGDLAAAVSRGAGGTPYRIVRVQSSLRAEPDLGEAADKIESILLNRREPVSAAKDLVESLSKPREILIVGAPAQQLHNLANLGKGKETPKKTQREWFDLIVLDEASQMDVATSTLVFSKRAQGGSCVVAGDDLQLPPIQQGEAPTGLEHVVGSVYNYLRHHLEVEYKALNVSFRTNAPLIAFTREAGYEDQLHAHSPELRLNLAPIPSGIPKDWPATLPWSPEYARILDPALPAVCLIHEDRQSAQSNRFEAEIVVALAALLRTHLREGPLQEKGPAGTLIDDGRYAAPVLYGADRFWEHGIGVVVPHRAQMSTVVGQLKARFPGDDSEKIRAAVDTVERFQGQQRDVIVASFGLGDPDVIAAEEEFLFQLRRFNVMASRARAKLVVLLTQSLIEHLSNDRDVLAESLLVKRYAEQFCEPLVVVELNGKLCEVRARGFD